MGLQHAMAMTGGIVLGPIIVAAANPNVAITQCKCHVAACHVVASATVDTSITCHELFR